MQKKNNTKRLISIVLCFLLVAATVLFMTACSNNKEDNVTPDSVSQSTENISDGTTKEDVQSTGDTTAESTSATVENENDITTEPADENSDSSTVNLDLASVENIGKGATSFFFTVTHKDGSEYVFRVNTDSKTVGEALSENGLISGEEGPYGLYVKEVDGETLDYDTDGYYWAFYQGSTFSATGVDMTDIEPEAIYSFKAAK
ncbi:MAG: hypothetical protein ACI4GC_07025 [Acutalibacteraceae bacterium]